MDTGQAFLQAIEAAKRKDFPAARELLRKIIQSEPNNIDAWLLFARVAQKREHAIKCLERVLELNPKHQYAQQLLTKITSDHTQKQSTIIPSKSKSNGQLETITPSRPAHEKVPSTPPVSNESTKVAQSKLSETTKRANREVKFLWAIGIITACCFFGVFGVVLFQNQIPFSLRLSNESTPTPDDLYNAIYSNIRAANSENITAYMATIHSESPLYDQTERLIKDAFIEYDLSYYVSELEIEKQSKSQVEIHFLLTTRKIRGPAFRDNVVEGIFIMRPEDGVWKIYNQKVTDVQYLTN